MSDNINIEELFRSNLGSLEADVSPKAWSNIQQGLNAPAGVTSAAAAKTGLSFITKSIIVSTGIVAATITGIYLWNNDQPQNNSNQSIVTVDDQHRIEEDQTKPLTDRINSGPQRVDLMEGNDVINPERQASDEISLPTSERNSRGLENETTVNSGSTEGLVSDDHNEGNGDAQITDDGAAAHNEIEKPEDNQDADETPVQKYLVVNPSYSILNDQNDAPATYIFEANAENCSSVRWDFGDGTTGEGFEVEHTYEKPGNYKVQMIAKAGQQNMMKSMSIKVESIAKIAEVNSNIFSPNGDGINDEYFIESENIEELAIIVTDAKGTIIWKSNEVRFNWNGTDLAGNLLPSGNYSYVLVAVGTDGGNIERRGFITLQR